MTAEYIVNNLKKSIEDKKKWFRKEPFFLFIILKVSSNILDSGQPVKY